MPLHHEPFDCFEGPPPTFAGLLRCNDPHRNFNIKHQRSTTIVVVHDPSVGQNTVRSSTIYRHLCLVFDCPLGLQLSPPVIVANFPRLGNRPSLFRDTAQAKDIRCVRVVVSMLPRRVFLVAFAYERMMMRSVRCWRCKPLTRRRTWWCTGRSLMMCCLLRANVAHSSRRDAITSASSMPTSTLSGEGIQRRLNRSKHLPAVDGSVV